YACFDLCDVLSVPTRRSSDLGSNCPRTFVARKASTAPTWAPENRAVTSEEILLMSSSFCSPIRRKAGSSMTCNEAAFALIQPGRSEEHTSELQSRFDLVCRLL